MEKSRTRKLKDRLKRGLRLRISLPFFSYEIALDDLATSETVNARIARFGDIKRDLEAAISAVQDLQYEANDRKLEADDLQALVAKLQEDKNAAESLLKIPEESFMRLVGGATSKGRIRGLMEGAFVGFITGVLSSLLVWHLTR
jgi:hypothetical protein